VKKFVSVFFLRILSFPSSILQNVAITQKYRFFNYVISLFETVKFENLTMESGEISNPMVVEGESNGSKRRIQW
jgi:hypothetical protein